ncbi:MATE family efflux transporter [Psychromonas marina]|uniref:Multidrug-efflux transporter n=1 Tax=Psychromonas marina TaxID=88364 RepID=A0ABQ6E2T8_9GAMM|nr:MATE family efflux transporter [Psychromonas marina]GLS91744.1 MATE family efflux transporter [Psychromonas marina]
MNVKTYQNETNNAIPNGLLSKVAKLAIPVAIQSALVAILAIADVLMVSDFGKEATASVGIASKWQFVAVMIIAGMSSANGILVAQYWGKNDRSSAKTITMLALHCGIKILIPVTLIMTLFSSYLMMLQTSDTKVIELGATYLWYSFPVLILTHMISISESAMRSSGDTMTPLCLGTVTIFINIALNFWLIKGGFGVPAMGVAGAALATTLSRLLQVGLIFMVLYRRQHWLFTTTTLVLSRSKKLWHSYKKLVIPSTASALVWACGTLTYQIVFGQMGTTELAVFSLLGPFESLCYSLFFGLSVACSVLLGQAMGKDDFAQAQQMSTFFIKIVLVVGVGTCLLLLQGQDQLLSWLHLSSDELAPLASPALLVLCCALWLRMLNMLIINGILRAGGDNLFCLRMDFISMWMVGVPLTAIAAFVLNWDFQYVYMMMLSEEIIKFSLCFSRYCKRHWLKNLTIVNA